jgi:protoheme IX farnesyltransferase
MNSRLKDYVTLAKPGIVIGNAITTVGGFFLALQGHRFPILTFVAALLGICLVMAAGCVCNNYLDREIDAKMARTKKRALVEGTISARNALLFATALGLAGLLVLAYGANPLSALLGIIGFVFYVWIYGFAKRHSVHGTLVGSIPGGIAAVVGYASVSNRMDAGAWILFLIMVVWQMPHFYAIAIYRLHDYQEAGIPVLPAVAGMKAAKFQIVAYIAAFLAVSLLLTAYGYTGFIYLIVMAGVGSAWLWMAVQGLTTPYDAVWARKIFKFSLVVVMVLSIMVSVGPVLI